MIGLRRIVSTDGKEYSIYQLPCSDEIEINHPTGFNYLVCVTPGLSEKYKILDYFKTFPEAELFLISQVKQTHNKEVVRIDLTKHKVHDGELYTGNIKVNQIS